MSRETFLSRWSRRKLGDPASAPPGEPVSPSGTAESPVPLDLPSIDDLNAESNFAPFLREGVPAELQSLALKKLWASDPVLSAMDPLDHHNLDYTTSPVLAQIAEVALERLCRSESQPDETPADLAAAPAAKEDSSGPEAERS